MKRKIYVASSWRNKYQPDVVKACRSLGHEVYDFRNPFPGNNGFAWSQLDENWLNWTPELYIKQLNTNIAIDGYHCDKNALDWCDTCILVLPCGRSAHLEAGYTIGQHKDTIIYVDSDKFEPDLMYLLANKVVTELEEVYKWIGSSKPQLGISSWS